MTQNECSPQEQMKRDKTVWEANSARDIEVGRRSIVALAAAKILTDLGLPPSQNEQHLQNIITIITNVSADMMSLYRSAR